MKQLNLLWVLLVMGIYATANPIPQATVWISELYFQEDGYWVLELGYQTENYNDITVDSIFIASSTDISRVTNCQIASNAFDCIVITNDSLAGDLQINPDGDSLTVLSYSTINDENTPSEHRLIFGNYNNASVSNPNAGQSIALSNIPFSYNTFSKDKSPTIGQINDTTGMCGTMQGKIYDIDNQPVSDRTFQFDFEFTTSDNGTYSTRMLSKNFYQNYITYYIGCDRYATIEPVTATIEPDTVIYRDIYLLDTLLTAIKDQLQTDAPVKIFPNPVSNGSAISMHLDLPLLSGKALIKIHNYNGKLLGSYPVSSKTTQIKTPEKPGLYMLSVFLDNRLLTSKKLIVENE